VDISKLITTGKLDKKVKVGEFTFYFETPASLNVVANLTDANSLLAQFIVGIDDEEYRTDERKKVLKDILDKMQNGFTNTLSGIAHKLGMAQVQAVEGMTENL
jgi:hypothetical protein